MATSKTDVKVTGSFSRTWDVIATADADTTITITHGLTGITDANANVVLTPLTAAGTLSTWQRTSVSAADLVLTKSTAVGSGAAPAQLRVHFYKHHSIDD